MTWKYVDIFINCYNGIAHNSIFTKPFLRTQIPDTSTLRRHVQKTVHERAFGLIRYDLMEQILHFQ